MLGNRETYSRLEEMCHEGMKKHSIVQIRRVGARQVIFYTLPLIRPPIQYVNQRPLRAVPTNHKEQITVDSQHAGYRMEM